MESQTETCKTEGSPFVTKHLLRELGGFMTLKTRFLIGLVVLSIVDAVIPVPIVGLILFFVLLQKPPWFQKLVSELYEA